MLAIGFFALAAPGIAHADDCSSPSDCSNTAWTVAGGAAVAAAIVGVAMGTRSEGGSGAEECEDAAALHASISARFQRLADLAVLRRGAMLSKARAEAQLRAAGEWAARLESSAQLPTTGAAIAASAGSATTKAAGELIEGTATSAIARQRLAALLADSSSHGGTLRAGASTGGRGAMSTASSWFSRFGAIVSVAGQYFNYQHRDDMRTLGILRQTMTQKQAEIERWTSAADEYGGKIDGGMQALRPAVDQFNKLNEQHGCGWSRLDLAQMQGLLDAPPAAVGAIGAVPQHILETEPPIRRATDEERAEERRRDRDRPVCSAYDADLAAWNSLVGQMTPKLDKWDEELRHWAARGAAVRRVMAHRSEYERQVREAIWGVTGNALGERALAGADLGIAAAGLVVASAPAVVALGIAGIVVSVARGQMSPTDAQLIAEGKIAAEMQFWASRLMYIRAEITRITQMRTEVLSELQRRRIRLDRTHAWCSPWWDDRGEQHERAEPVPIRYRRDYSNFDAHPSARYSAMPLHDLMQEIRTWR